MANLLKMAISETIRTLHRRGWSQRRIADELGVNRETVARHLRVPEPGPKPANAPAGSQPADGAAKPANAPTGSGEADDAPDPAIAPAGGARSRRHAAPAASAAASRGVSRSRPRPVRGCPPSGSTRTSSPTTATPAATTPSAGSCTASNRSTNYPSGAWRPTPVRKPRWTSAPARGRRPRRQASQAPRLPHRPQPQPQGLQRGRMAAEFGGVHAVPRKRLPPLRRRARSIGH